MPKVRDRKKGFVRDWRYRVRMAKGFENNVFLVDRKKGLVITPWCLKFNGMKIGDVAIITDDPTIELKIRLHDFTPEGDPVYQCSYSAFRDGRRYIGTTKGPSPATVVRNPEQLKRAYGT